MELCLKKSATDLRLQCHHVRTHTARALLTLALLPAYQTQYTAPGASPSPVLGNRRLKTTTRYPPHATLLTLGTHFHCAPYHSGAITCALHRSTASPLTGHKTVSEAWFTLVIPAAPLQTHLHTARRYKSHDSGGLLGILPCLIASSSLQVSRLQDFYNLHPVNQGGPQGTRWVGNSPQYLFGHIFTLATGSWQWARLGSHNTWRTRGQWSAYVAINYNHKCRSMTPTLLNDLGCYVWGAGAYKSSYGKKELKDPTQKGRISYYLTWQIVCPY